MLKQRLAAILFTDFLTAPASAGDVVLGAGSAFFNFPTDRDTAIIEAEFHSTPFTRLGTLDISWAAAAAFHVSGTYWVGAGLSAILPLRQDWFVEGSFMPGYYEPFDTIDDLGADIEFRSLIGVGKRLSDNTRISVAISHKSNGDTGTINPGVDAISFRLRHGFN